MPENRSVIVSTMIIVVMRGKSKLLHDEWVLMMMSGAGFSRLFDSKSDEEWKMKAE